MPNLKRHGETITIICAGCGKTCIKPDYYDYVPKFCSAKCSNQTHNKEKKLYDRCIIAGCDKPNHIGGLCQMHHWRKKHYGNPLREPYPVKLCSVDGCGRKRNAHGLCALHARRKKNGIPMDYIKPVLKKKYYIKKTIKDHPLANANGKVSEHRVILFNDIGFLAVPCYWCGKRLVFGDNLVVDHLNHDRHDNRIQNLVPSCNSCNAGRTIANSHIRESVYVTMWQDGVSVII